MNAVKDWYEKLGSKARTERVMFMMSESDKGLLEDVAHAAGVSVSKLCYVIIRENLDDVANDVFTRRQGDDDENGE